jgi:hypothetical protein
LGFWHAPLPAGQSRHSTPALNLVLLNRNKTVTKSPALGALGLASSEKQIPQVVENNESRNQRIERLEGNRLRVKQAL